MRGTFHKPVRPDGLIRIGSLRSEAGSFGIVGVISTVVDVGAFNALHAELAIQSLLSKVLSTAAATVVSYGGSRLWTFRHRSEHPVKREFPRFAVLTLVGLGISLAVLATARYGMHERGLLALNIAANGVGLGLATLWRFWAYRRWVFTRDETRAPS